MYASVRTYGKLRHVCATERIGTKLNKVILGVLGRGSQIISRNAALTPVSLEFFMPRCGATFDENSSLLGGVSDSGRVAPKALGWVMRCGGTPTPAAFATAV